MTFGADVGCHSNEMESIQHTLCPNYHHCSDVIMGAITSKITRLTILYSTVYSGTGQRKYQSSASLAFVRGIRRGPVNSPHIWPVTQRMFPLDYVIMLCVRWGTKCLSVSFWCENNRLWDGGSDNYIITTIYYPARLNYTPWYPILKH